MPPSREGGLLGIILALVSSMTASAACIGVPVVEGVDSSASPPNLWGTCSAAIEPHVRAGSNWCV